PEYHGIPEEDHFRSYVNLSTLLGEIEAAVRLNGSGVLNAEAALLGPKYGQSMADIMASNPDEPVGIVAHSQGANNAVHAMLWLINQFPQFFTRRAVRCVFCDAKVGRNYMEQLFGTFP